MPEEAPASAEAQPQEQGQTQEQGQDQQAPLSLEEQLQLYSVDENGQPAFELADDADWDPGQVAQPHPSR